MAKKRRKEIDWEVIEKFYRAGQLSIREIAKQNNCSDTVIRRKAKKKGWERDLTDKVSKAVRTKLVRSANTAANPQTEREIIEEAAETSVAVVRGHQKRLRDSNEVVDILLGQLKEIALNRKDLEEAIEKETEDDQSSKRRDMLLRAVSLKDNSSVALNLTNALKSLIALERQAFNISDETAEKETDLAKMLADIDAGGLPLK